MAIGMKNNPVKTDNANLLATVYTNENKALLVIAKLDGSTTKWQKISIDEKALGFQPSYDFIAGNKGHTNGVAG